MLCITKQHYATGVSEAANEHEDSLRHLVKHCRSHHFHMAKHSSTMHIICSYVSVHHSNNSSHTKKHNILFKLAPNYSMHL